MSLITVIGRGHGGTRAMSHTLTASGVYMGSLLNTSGDLLPPQPMYDACRLIAKHVVWKGGLEWDFSQLIPNDNLVIGCRGDEELADFILSLPH